MNKRSVNLWYISLGLLITTIIPFIKLMCSISLKNVCITAIWLTITTGIYLFMTSRITHEKGYTAVEAISFYRLCKKNGIKEDKLLKSSQKLKEIASQREYSKDLETKDLYEMYRIGDNILNTKRR